MIIWEYKVWQLSWKLWFNDLPIQYEQRLFTKTPIDNLTDNILETLKISSINQPFDDRIYEINTQNADFNDLPFNGDERLTTRWWIYC